MARKQQQASGTKFGSPKKVQFQCSQKTSCDNDWLKMAYAQVLGVWSMRKLLYVHCLLVMWLIISSVLGQLGSLKRQCTMDRQQLQISAYKLWASWSLCWERLKQCTKELGALPMISRTSMLNTADETWNEEVLLQPGFAVDSGASAEKIGNSAQ